VAEDLAAVFGVGLGDLLGQRLGGVVLTQRAEQGQGAGLGGGVAGEVLEQQGQRQRNELLELGGGQAGLFGQGFDCGLSQK
jgi:hypothetical protein